MPAIKMLTTQEGSTDGLTSRIFQEGQEYDLDGREGEDLARSFLAEGWAELVAPAPGPQQNAAAPPPQAPAASEKPQRPPAGGKR